MSTSSTSNQVANAQFVSGLFYYACNHLFNKVPSQSFRKWLYTKLLGYQVGKNAIIQMGCYIYCRGNIGMLKIGDDTMINRECVLDSRGGLYIGSKVNISPYVQIYTASHDPQSSTFAEVRAAVYIDDYCWLSTRSMILPGVHIGKGAIVAAGAVVSRNVEPYSIVGGIPAHVIGKREQNLNYSPIWNTYMQ